MNADSIKVECEEDGFWLVVETDEQVWTQFGLRARIEDPEALYDAVRSEIGPWLQEREDARRTLPVASYDPSDAYDPTDPKRLDYHWTHDRVWDSRAGK